MNLEVCIYNLGTYEEVCGDITTMEELNELKRKVNPLGHNDVDIQLLDADVDVKANDVETLLYLAEEHPEYAAEDIAMLLYHTDYSITLKVLEQGLPYVVVSATNKTAAFMEYYKDMNYPMPPAEWADFIDWDLKLEEFDNNGLMIENLGPSGKHDLTDNFLLVQTY